MKHVKQLRTALLVLTSVALSAHADGTTAAQPDATDAIAYVAAGTATVVLAFVPQYGVTAGMWVARKVRSVFGR